MFRDNEGTVWNRLIPGEENTYTELKNLSIYTMYCVRIMGYNRRGDGIASYPVCTYTDKDGKLITKTKNPTSKTRNPAGFLSYIRNIQERRWNGVLP